MRVPVGPLADLQAKGCVAAKAGAQPICVFWHDGRAYALDDRCPHLGFPLHRGSVEDGLLTCHWHHARFDLASGSTLTPFADDVRTYPVEIEGDQVVVVAEEPPDRAAQLQRRLREGLEQSLTLVTAKSVLGLEEAGVPAVEVVRTGVEFGTAYRREGWGSGLTVLVAMANLLPHLDPADRPLALVHGLAFVARDTRNHAPAFPLTPLGTADVDDSRLKSWYRRFVESRSGAGAERVLLTAIAAAGGGKGLAGVAELMTAAVTDHVFIDGGHALDFTNKAFEALDLLGPEAAADVLPTLVDQTAGARRSEEEARWRHPRDLVSLLRRAEDALPGLVAAGQPRQGSFTDVAGLGWEILGDDPGAVVDALCEAVTAGATPEQLGRALALAAALRITRFHTQNELGDWDTVHHGFTAANALHQALVRAPSVELLRGVLHGALKVYLDRFLNVPAARLPRTEAGDLDDLQACWDGQGHVDEAGGIVYGYLRDGGDPGRVVATLGRALLAEDAQFHWFQTVEAAVRQFHAWPAGSEEGRLVLAGTARFLAAHTPTRRELPHVVRTATRLRRGDALYEEDE